MIKNPFGQSDPEPKKNPSGVDRVAAQPKDSTLRQEASNPVTVMVPPGRKLIVFKKEFAPALLNELSELESAIGMLKPVTSQEDVANVNSVLKKGSKYLKKFDEQRKEMGEALTVYKDELLQDQKHLLAKLSELIKTKDTEIVTFQREEDRKAKEKQAQIQRDKDAEISAANKEKERVNGILNLISNFESSTLRAISECDINTIDTLGIRISDLIPSHSVYMEYSDQATQVKSDLLTRIASRKEELIQLEHMKASNAKAAEELAKQQKEQADKIAQDAKDRAADQQQAVLDQAASNIANSQMHAEFKTNVMPAAKNVMKRWVFDLAGIDMSLLPAEYHTPDADKIKAAIAAGARDIPGVRITEEISNVKR
jgi:hypothetical protein